MIYPRLKDGRDNREGLPVAWTHYNREEDRVRSKIEILYDLLKSMPRRSHSHFIYGIPGLDFLMVPVFMNVPTLLEEYGLLEVFYFSTDSLGHLYGREAHKRSLFRFDTYLGVLLERLNLSTTNLILYADHGMSMGDLILIDVDEELGDVVGEEMIYCDYPNLYLHNPSRAQDLAARIIEETSMDFVFYQRGPEEVEGLFSKGRVLFEENHQGIRYTYTHEDPFSYYELGYRGEYLSFHEWLLFTKESQYPAVPPNLYSYVKNEMSGDIVFVLNPPKILKTIRANKGNHAGFSSSDLMVPILLKGEELEHLYEEEVLLLHELFTTIDISFHDSIPVRERHLLSCFTDSLAMKISPSYRWYMGVEIDRARERYSLSLEYDLFSSFLSRFWLGLGVKIRDMTLGPFLKARYQFEVGSFGFESKIEVDRELEREKESQIYYRILQNLSLHLSRERFGLTFLW